jgi:hypothetical protein
MIACATQHDDDSCVYTGDDYDAALIDYIKCRDKPRVASQWSGKIFVDGGIHALFPIEMRR